MIDISKAIRPCPLVSTVPTRFYRRCFYTSAKPFGASYDTAETGSGDGCDCWKMFCVLEMRSLFLTDGKGREGREKGGSRVKKEGMYRVVNWCKGTRQYNKMHSNWVFFGFC